MTKIVEDVAQLSEHIGPRPAGTEEEQQAALYIADELQKGAGFSTIIEDFNCLSSATIVRTICFAVGFLAALLPLFLPVVAVPACMLGLIAAVVYVLEITGKEVISRFFHTGVSQNVVAKYQPTGKANTPRSRKIILIANYDSAKEDKKYQSPVATVLGKIRLAVLIGLVAAPVILLIRTVFFLNTVGGIVVFFNILTVICLLLMLLPLVDVVLQKMAAYNQAANNNAAGVGVLLETARTIGNGLVSNEDVEARAEKEGVVVHGEDAARSAGVVPEGVEVDYETSQRNVSPEESLAQAKAAIAALTGKPVADKVPVTDISSRLVKIGEPADAESASVHFEVDEHVGQQPLKSSSPVATTPRARIEEQRAMAQEEEKRAQNQQAERRASFQEEGAGAVPVTSTMTDPAAGQPSHPVVAQPSAAKESSVPFTRETPQALQSGQTGAAVKVDKTPAWAKSAQAKAHANKPDLEVHKKVSRSRFADTVAAQMTDASRAAATGATNAFSAVTPDMLMSEQPEEATHEAAEQKPMTELEARLAALHSEIAATEVPHLSDEAKAAFDRMGEQEESITSRQAQNVGQGGPSSDSVTALETESFKVAAAPTQSAPAPTKGLASEQRAGETGSERAGSTAPMPTQAAVNAAPVNAAPKESADPIVVSVTNIAEEEEHNPAQAPSTSASVASTARSKSAKSLGVVTKRVPKKPAAEEPQPERGAVQPERVTIEAELPLPAVEQKTVDGKTQAIAPIDVSALLNKEPEEEPSQANPQEVEQEPAPQQSEKQDQTRVAPADPSPLQTPAVASPIVGMDTISPLQSEQIPVINIPSEQSSQAERQVIVLPDVMSAPNVNTEVSHQRAPMAESNESTRSGTKALLSNMLPRIDENGVPVTHEASARDTFGAQLPPLGESKGVEHNTVSPTGSFSTVGGTGAFAPVGDELVADVAPEDLYVDDADDSAYDQDYTQTGAFAGSGYVDMPKSRAGRLFGRFRSKKKKQEESSMREWINTDETYTARNVGKERGSWESFREDNSRTAAQNVDDQFIDVDYSDTSFDNSRDWNGGAFSLKRLRRGNVADDEFENEEVDEGYAEDFDEDYLAASPTKTFNDAVHINQELKKLKDFRYPGIDTEVWFVALGAEHAAHSGMQAFIQEHADELKGAIFINLEALGAGRLTFIEREGFLKPKAVSSRMKRFLRSASEKSGVLFSTATMDSRDTAAQYAMARGYQAMTLMGMEEGQAALYGSKDDTIENIDQNTLEENVAFVMAILKSM